MVCGGIVDSMGAYFSDATPLVKFVINLPHHAGANSLKENLHETVGRFFLALFGVREKQKTA
jgi:hypothetical protein